MIEQPTEHECKLRFAYYLHKLGNALDAMTQLASEHGWLDPTFIITTSKRWQFDPLVEAEVERLNIQPAKKGVVVKVLLDKLNSKAIDDADAARVARVIAEIEGWIAKPTAADGKRSGEDKLEELAAMIVEPVEETSTEVIVDAPQKGQDTNGIIQPEK